VALLGDSDADGQQADDDDGEEEMRFSLTLGRMVPNHKHRSVASSNDSTHGSRDLTTLNTSTQIIESFGSLAVAHSQREWQVCATLDRRCNAHC
jgi:hypothetical protein